MRKFYFYKRLLLFFASTLLISSTIYGQITAPAPVIPTSTKISNYSLFAGNSNNFSTDSTKYGITFFSVVKVFSGDVGSRGQIQLDLTTRYLGTCTVTIGLDLVKMTRFQGM